MPFGLRNAPASFQRAIDIILSSVHFKSVIVYLENIIVFSKNIDEHMDNLETVLSLLQNAGLTIKLNKCFFMHESIEYLGNIVRQKELLVEPKTIDAVQRMKAPENKTQIRSFIGLCNVYRRLVKDFASIAALLNKQLKKTTSEEFNLKDDQTESFEELKNRLTSPPVLALPRSDKHYTLDMDANAEQLGFVLLQEHDDEPSRSLGYFSRKLNDAERNYDTTERECLAIIWAILMLRPYLDGVHFTLRTDHDALKWLFGPASTSGKLARWRIHLREFTFKVEDIPGTKNAAAEAMSRLETKGGDST